MNMIENNTAVSAPTKNIELAVRCNSGQTFTAIVPVHKGKYASVQSKACTYKQALIAGIATKKYTAEQAKELWQANVVDKWAELVTPSYEAALPQVVRNEVAEIRPASNMLDFDVAE